MKLIWCSDIHLNFLNLGLRIDFYNKITEAKGNAVVISGDIAESHNVVPLLEEMQNVIKIPIYFVLGNHDFYGSSVKAVKRSVRPFGYLGVLGLAPLTENTVVLGVDGWGDCRNGDFKNSRLTMSDWFYIDDLKDVYHEYNLFGRDMLKRTLQKLADSDARKLKRKVLRAIAEGYTKLIIVTHVPPFEEVCIHAGKKSTPDGLPFFSSKILGTTILPIAQKYPEIDFLWLSGHTHSRATYSPCPNMICKVAKAEYYFPQIEEIIEV